MLQYQMLDASKLSTFFAKHDIPLEGEKPFKTNAVDVVADALRFGGTVFMCFVVHACLNADRTAIQTVFDSYEEVEEAYTQYLMGYYKKDRLQA